MGERIKIVLLGDINSAVLPEIVGQVSRVFAATVAIADTQYNYEPAYNSGRNQYSAESFLKHLNMLREDNVRVLGITDVDLYIPYLNYVFGLTDEASDVAVVSIARFKRGDGREVERAVKTAIHELGHTYGLAHCNNNRCVMYFSYNLCDTDYKGKEFCVKCRKELNTKISSREVMCA